MASIPSSLDPPLHLTTRSAAELVRALSMALAGLLIPPQVLLPTGSLLRKCEPVLHWLGKKVSEATWNPLLG